VTINQRRIGILGGTFDPIHQGHLDVGDAAVHALQLTKLFVITSNVPPHRPQTGTSSFHRFAMVSLALATRPGWRASDLELRMSPPSYTAHTLRHYHERGYAASELFFLIGADAFHEIHHWHDYPAILEAARFVVVSRPGYDPAAAQVSDTERAVFVQAQTTDVSSSAIRRARAEGRPIEGMVPPAVQQHIEQHGLYSPMPPDRRLLTRRDPVAADRLHGEN